MIFCPLYGHKTFAEEDVLPSGFVVEEVVGYHTKTPPDELRDMNLRGTDGLHIVLIGKMCPAQFGEDRKDSVGDFFGALRGQALQVEAGRLFFHAALADIGVVLAEVARLLERYLVDDAEA